MRKLVLFALLGFVHIQALHLWSSHKVETKQQFWDTGAAKRLAVLVTGLQDRFLIDSKIKNVIQESAKQGYEVDLYISLVKNTGHPDERNGRHVTGSVDATVANTNVANEDAIRKAISGAGGHLVEYNLLDQQEKVTIPENHPKRLTSYFDEPRGVNVLRRFLSLEKLFKQTVTSGSKYDFVLVTRDDDHWLGPLNLAEFEKDVDAPKTLFTKNCKQQTGVNDKTLLFGGEAAQAMLSTIHSHFFNAEPSFITFNSESFLHHFALNKGVRLKGAAFGSIPTVDSLYVRSNDGEPYLCHKQGHLCSNLPTTLNEKPRTCPQ